MNSVFTWRGFHLASYLPTADKSLLWDTFILVTDCMLLGSWTLNECKLPEMWSTDQKALCVQVVAVFTSPKDNSPLWTFTPLKRQHAACFHYFVKFIIPWPWKVRCKDSETSSSHFSQCFPVSPSLQTHCCHDHWSTQVPSCWQGLVVQAPSSLGHLKKIRKADVKKSAHI